MGLIELHTSFLPLSLFEVTNEVLPEQLEKLRQKAQEVRNASKTEVFFLGKVVFGLIGYWYYIYIVIKACFCYFDYEYDADVWFD